MLYIASLKLIIYTSICMHLDHSIYIQVDNLKQIITKEVFSVPSFSRELQIREFNKLQVTSLFNNYQKDIDP